MHNVKMLEDEWRKYNAKKRRPWYLFATAVAAAIALSFVSLKYNLLDFLLLNTQNNKKFVDQNITKKEYQAIKLQDENNDPMGILAKSRKDLSIDDIKKPKIKAKPKTEVFKKPRKKVHLNIIKTSNEDAYSKLEKRFHKFHDTEDSLFLAENYYNNGNYKKSEYWALETNKIDASIEESLFIFVKSKVKLNNIDEAIRILTSYIKESNSKRAKNLLQKIEKGSL